MKYILKLSQNIDANNYYSIKKFMSALECRFKNTDNQRLRQDLIKVAYSTYKVLELKATSQNLMLKLWCSRFKNFISHLSNEQSKSIHF